MAKNIGIFLGTFDPIHKGHLNIAKNIKSQLKLDRVLILPLYDAPHKSEIIESTGVERFEMCDLACEEIDGIEASSLEIEHRINDYSIRMIEVIQEKYPEDHLYYIIGSDVFLSILKWDNLESLIAKVDFAVALRFENDIEQVNSIITILENKSAQVHLCKFQTMAVSSSKIKQQLRNDLSCEVLLPEAVITYIKENKLYRGL